MSIENIFNKLDEKISYLIRNLGFIITILFGFSAIIYNIFGLTPIIIFFTIILVSLFLFDLIYALYIYIGYSSKVHDFIYELMQYEEFLRLSRTITLSKYSIDIIEKIYQEQLEWVSGINNRVLGKFESFGYQLFFIFTNKKSF